MHAAIPELASTVLYSVDWNNVFDFSAMEPHVDHYIIMGYAYYYQGSCNMGPCDPLYHFGSNYIYTLSKALHITLAMAVQKQADIGSSILWLSVVNIRQHSKRNICIRGCKTFKQVKTRLWKL